MSKILYVKANAKPEGVSRTFKVSDSFVKAYKELHPDDEIITLDLYKEDLRWRCKACFYDYINNSYPSYSSFNIE